MHKTNCMQSIENISMCLIVHHRRGLKDLQNSECKL